MATNPANNICNLDSVQQNLIRGYLTNGGKTNYRNMLNYIRKAIDGKISSIPEVEDPAERPSDMLYHAELTNPDDELEFLTVADYEKFMKDNRLYKEGARKIMITGQMADATGLIEALEKEGYNVYPVQVLHTNGAILLHPHIVQRERKDGWHRQFLESRYFVT